MHFALATLAVVLEAGVGYPDALYRRIGHPVVWFGALISALDTRLNHDSDSFSRRRLRGVATVVALVATAGIGGVALTKLCGLLTVGPALLAFFSSSLLAQRSLHEHVERVASALTVSLAEGRRAVSLIVGRDVSALDEAGVARAAIESLAENFSDGVVAPALFLGFFGLPGALVYKAVNTADSMIGHKSARYLAFGQAAARLDDALNLLPARLAAALIVMAAPFLQGASATGAIRIVRRDASHHASPNAGWPEAAMAGALGLTLGGPRAYDAVELTGAFLGDGRREATVADINRALALYRRATLALWMMLVLAAMPGL